MNTAPLNSRQIANIRRDSTKPQMLHAIPINHPSRHRSAIQLLLALAASAYASTWVIAWLLNR